ncbi:ribosome-dependent ATPase [Tistlia consotensis]|uniref:Ribosome-dependent ATPase n=1 Tax=Tistlia consotensis USBA 355 TaxID=560819 RepID=A0A1Y6CK35_9PROT|nr:ribosome-associated ATPase/putative transporter RbbA [Tistlia consotensis]SMF60076.1 ribosome-dependent ATPase [Tistlia consotensis USBA 355]SNR93935.1 ribosome-dependent ATPase [Tistlia consotensis]
MPGADRPAVRLPAVRIQGLGHCYGGHVALAGLELEIAAGEAVAVVGPDGVGKSSLLALIAGAKRLQQGTLEVLGGSMASATHRRRIAQRVAFMPQGLGRNLYPTLSVAENLAFFGRLYGQGAAERRQRIDRLLAATGLDPFPDRPAGKLSGGMKQKLALCAALIHEPDLLVLDEPTTGVDPLSRRQFWQLIDAIRAERPAMTLVVATAYMEEAERFGRLVALGEGRLLAEGPLAAILAQTGAGRLEEAYRRLQDGAAETDEGFSIAPRRPYDGPPVIEAEGLTRRFGDFVAVDAVSFQIERGEIFGFLGSNGCGKTTTMKMLTGLLPASAGSARLLGKPVDGQSLETRLKVGYVSQSFSLYEELSVGANLALHARLYRVPEAEVAGRVAEALEQFDLGGVADALPGRLPLGQRQRLQLAAACLHRPEVLILDEPTSGVDPAARDLFWRILGRLSRDDGVTVFVSTHFMNEAERCDRISLMHRGRVLAVDRPQTLAETHGGGSLEEAFVAYLEAAARKDAAGEDGKAPAPGRTVAATAAAVALPAPGPVAAALGRIWAFAWRESLEVLRDPIRLAFALLGPLILLFAFAYGISFDVEHLTWAPFDRDQSVESRRLLEAFDGSRYFDRRPPVADEFEIDRRLRSGELRAVVGIPPGFGRDLLEGRQPEVSIWLDGSMPFRAETARGYIQGLLTTEIEQQARERTTPGKATPSLSVEPRFRYNQEFRSLIAMTPGTIMLLLVLIPAMLTALGVVREKEIGSIMNLYAAPATVGEFLLGKQLPYVAVSMIAFALLLACSLFVLGVPLTGGLGALVVGALLYVWAATGFGLLVSTLVSSQVAAIFASSILTVVPAVNFSGLLYPTASLEGSARWLGILFPASWFKTISNGTFSKGLGFADLGSEYLALAGFALVFLLAARLLLRKQER